MAVDESAFREYERTPKSLRERIAVRVLCLAMAVLAHSSCRLAFSTIQLLPAVSDSSLPHRTSEEISRVSANEQTGKRSQNQSRGHLHKLKTPWLTSG